MKNILVFGMTNNPGGIETYIMNMLNVVDKSKFHFDMLTVFDNIVYAEELKKLNCNIYKINSFISNPLLHKKQLLDILKNNNYDCIYMNVMDAGSYFTAKIAKKAGLKVIVHSHNSNTNRKFLHNILKNKISKVADIRLACSKDAGQFMFSDDSFKVIPNAIDFNKYYFNVEDRLHIRNNLKIDNNSTVFCHTGRMVDQKNPLFLINLFFKLYQIDSNIYLIYVGDGILKNQIYNLVEELDKKIYGFKDHIKFIGTVSKEFIPQYLSASDVFLLPSKYEGLPISLIETVVNGLKCYTSKFISKEVDILANIEYIDLDINKWSNAIEQYLIAKDDRAVLNIDSEYDINNNKFTCLLSDILNEV